jgi:flagellar hook-length control protein FliK
MRHPAAQSSIEALEARSADAGKLLVQVASDRPQTITPPQRALGGQTALAAQTIAADLIEARRESRKAEPGSDASARIRHTEVGKNSVPAKNSATEMTAEAAQPVRASASSAAGATMAASADRSLRTPLAGDAGGRPFGFQGSPAPAPGQATPLATGYAVQSVRPTAGPQAPAEQVAVQIRRAANGVQDRINIRLYPAELGRIDVKMEWADDGVLRAAISVERSETLDLLQRDSRALHRALQEAGLKTDSGSLSFDLRGHAEGHAKPSEDGEDRFARPESGSQEQGAAKAGVEPAEHHRVHDGILDLSV